jgi:hypothetical protein
MLERASRFEPYPLFAAVKLGLDVRVSEDTLKSVVFIGQEINGQFSPLGSGFLGMVPLPEQELICMFLITADHILDSIKEDGEFSVRLNRHSGDCRTVTIKKTPIFRHSDKRNDIAIFFFTFDPTIYDHKCFLLLRDHHIKQLEKYSPCIGDEVVSIGLYTTHYGITKNVPVVRVGNISMMPNEPIWGKRGFIEGYLIESRSIAGLSGSPVLLSPPPVRQHDGKIQHLMGPLLVPIGLCLGYHKVQSAEDQIPVPKFQGEEPGTSLSADERNTGLAVVVPFARILEMVESEEMRENMRKDTESFVRSAGFQPTGVVGGTDEAAPAATEANPTHREDFSRLLGVAARKKRQDDQTS